MSFAHVVFSFLNVMEEIDKENVIVGLKKKSQSLSNKINYRKRKLGR